MNIYTLMQCENGDINLSHTSCCYPRIFENKINALAGEKITTRGESISFVPALVQNFSIMNDKKQLFIEKVLPHVGFKQENGICTVWDKDEVCYEI